MDTTATHDIAERDGPLQQRVSRETGEYLSPRGERTSLVAHPAHYNQGKIEVIDFLEDQALDYHCASAVAYICRARYKSHEVEDLQKAVWYIQRKIAALTAS